MQVLNRSYQIFRKLLIFNGSVLFSMSLQRLVLFLIVVRHWTFAASAGTLVETFVAGIRFDLCVLAFINIPVLFVTWWICSDQMLQTKNPILNFLRKWSLWIYLGGTTLVIHVFGLLDLMFFATSGHRWTYADWQSAGVEFFGTVATRWGSLFTGGVVAFFLMLWVFRCLFILFRVQLHVSDLPTDQLKLWPQIMRGVVVPVFILALAARGTVTAHHLGFEHAEISSVQGLNQLALSPIWAFDKKF